MREGPGVTGGGAGISADGRRWAGEGGTRRGRQHTAWADTRFLGGTVPAAALPLSEGGRKVVGGGELGGDGLSAAGLSLLNFFPELAGLELPVFGITALTVE